MSHLAIGALSIKYTFLAASLKITWLVKICHGGYCWRLILHWTVRNMLFLHTINSDNKFYWRNNEKNEHCIYFQNVYMYRIFTLRKVVTKWKWLHSSFFVLKFKPLASTTLGKNSHPLRERTISKVFVLIYIMCFLAPEKLKKTLTFLTARKCFPRARLISNININVSKLIVIQISCSAKNHRKALVKFSLKFLNDIGWLVVD